MSMKAETVGTVREREREKLHFSNRECGFVQQSDTHTSNSLKNKKIINIKECNKKDSDET